MPSDLERTFSADAGDLSEDVSNAGPDTIENDLDMIITAINKFYSTVGGASGGDQVSMTAINPFISEVLQAFLEELVARIQATTDSSSGADLVGATAITSLDGTTVQGILESIRTKLKGMTDGSSGADFIAATAISDLTGATVQALLESVKDYIDTHKAASTLNHPNSSVTTIKIADDAVTDTKIGNRTVDQSIVTAFANIGTLTQILSWVAKVLKEVKGTTNWYDSPSTDLDSVYTKDDVDSNKVFPAVVTTNNLPSNDPKGAIRTVVDIGDGNPGTYQNQDGAGTWALIGNTIVTDHGMLIGLGDNDHSQYILQTEYNAHLVDSMPHATADGGYVWGLRINPDLSATLVYEVVE